MIDDWSFLSCGYPGCDAEKGVTWGFDDEFQIDVITREGWKVLNLRQGEFRCPEHQEPDPPVGGDPHRGCVLR